MKTRETGLVYLFAFASLLIHLLTNSRYGYFRDELYFIACSRHLDFGYVDMSPLSAWLLRLQAIFFGDSLFTLRLFPAIAHALTVALTGAIARQLGGRLWAIALACTASMSTLVYLGVGNFYSMNVFEPLFWMGCAYQLVRIINSPSPPDPISPQPSTIIRPRSGHLWLWFGVVAGFGFLNKHSIVFFGAGVTVALLLTERRQLVQPWIWLGGLIALAIAMPNVLWQERHDWPTLELLRNVERSGKNVVLGPLQFILQQILIMNPATFPLWLAGLVWLLASRHLETSGPGAGRLHAHAADTGAGAPSRRNVPRYRLLAIAYLITLAEFILMHGKHYYLAPVYPMLFAAGGVAVERLFAIRLRWVKPVLGTAMIALAALLAPTILPILPPEKLLAYMRALRFEPPRTETGHTAALPQLFADQFGWEEMVRSVARAYASLSPEDQKRAGIFCQDYGQASAVDFFGPRYGLPSALSGHQNYYLWGPRDYTGEILLVLDSPSGDEPEQFRTVEDLGPVESSSWAMPFEQRTHIYLCRDLKVPLRDLWPELKKWL